MQHKSESNKKAEYFSNLPNEIVIQIFGHLELHDVMNLNVVCRRWYDLSSLDELWEKFVPRYSGVDLPQAKSKKKIFQKLWSNSVKIGKERWFPNPLPCLVEYNTSLQKYNEQIIPKNINESYGHSKCVLYLRLNRVYPFASGGIKHEDPLLLEMADKLSDNLGNIAKKGCKFDVEIDEDVVTSLVTNSFLGNKKFIMELILSYSYDCNTNATVPYSINEPVIDEEGKIVRKSMHDDSELLDDESLVTGGRSLSKKVFNQIRDIVIGKNIRFMIYDVDERRENENDRSLMARQIVVSGTAVYCCARRFYWVRDLVD